MHTYCQSLSRNLTNVLLAVSAVSENTCVLALFILAYFGNEELSTSSEMFVTNHML